MSNDEAQRPHRLLISYHYARGKNLGDEGKKHWPNFPVKIFGDSGAYSAWSLGKPIHVDEYAEWLKENKPFLACYANLDMIGSPEGSARNLAKLEAHGLNPLPVFHYGSPFEELEKIIDAGYPYICLGGCVGRPSGLLIKFAIRCFKIARAKDKGTVFHGFGLTNLKCIMNLPWYSVDSSSWGQAYRFGTVKLFDPTKGDFVSCQLFTDQVDKHARLIRTYGGNVECLRDRKLYHHSMAAELSALSWRGLESYCRRRHGKVLMRDEDPGQHLYMAGAGGDLTGRIRGITDKLAGMHLYLADGSTTQHGSANKGIAENSRARGLIGEKI